MVTEAGDEATTVVVNVEPEPTPEPEPEPPTVVVVADDQGESAAREAGDALAFAEQIRAISREVAIEVVQTYAPSLSDVVEVASNVAEGVASEVVEEEAETAPPPEPPPAPAPAPDPEPTDSTHWWFRSRKRA